MSCQCLPKQMLTSALFHTFILTIYTWLLQIWDPELSVVAQAHADQCKFAHDCSDCRRVSRFGVGQNLYIYKQVTLCFFFN